MNVSLELSYLQPEAIIIASVASKSITSDFNKAVIEQLGHLKDQQATFLQWGVSFMLEMFSLADLREMYFLAPRLIVCAGGYTACRKYTFSHQFLFLHAKGPQNCFI